MYGQNAVASEKRLVEKLNWSHIQSVLACLCPKSVVLLSEYLVTSLHNVRMSVLSLRLELNLPPRCPNGSFVGEERTLLVRDDELWRTILSEPEVFKCWKNSLWFSTGNQFALCPSNAHTTHVCNDHVSIVTVDKEEIKLDTFIELAGKSQ